MNTQLQPKAEANKISKLLDTVMGEERYPVDVHSLALEFSGTKFSDEPISEIQSAPIESFQGALIKHRKKSKWKIMYNDSIESEGRIRFTLAHEFGHYILHRNLNDNFSCTYDKYESYDDGEIARIEYEADEFSSCLLMPFHDFRKQTQNEKISIQLLMYCADRYGVSLMAAALKWKDILPKRVVVVAAKDGFLLWASSNRHAFKSGAYIATKQKPIQVPKESLINTAIGHPMGEVQHQKARIWFPDEPLDMPITEHVFISRSDYEYTLCILELPDAEPNYQQTHKRYLS